MAAKIRNKNDITKKWKRNILSSLEKEAPTVSPLGYKKAASRVMPLLLPYLEQAAGYLGTDISSYQQSNLKKSQQ